MLESKVPMFYMKKKRRYYSYVDWAIVKINNIRTTPEVFSSFFQTRSIDLPYLPSWMDETRILIRFYKQARQKDRNRYQFKRFNCPSDYEPMWTPKFTVYMMIEEYPFEQMNITTVKPAAEVACGLPGCGFRTPRPDKLDEHRNQCQNFTSVITKLKVYGENIESTDPFMKFAVYDLETVEKPTDNNAEARLELLCIGVASNVCGYESKYFCRKTSSNLDGQKTVDLFLDHLFELKSKYQNGMDPEIKREYSELVEQLKDTSIRWTTKQPLLSRKQQLKEQLQFSVFGFNAAKFDMKVLLGYVATYAKKKNLDVELLKKGSIYFNFTIDDVIFKGKS